MAKRRTARKSKKSAPKKRVYKRRAPAKPAASKPKKPMSEKMKAYIARRRAEAEAKKIKKISSAPMSDADRARKWIDAGYGQ